nr:protein TPR1-like [Ipomoea batatas]
MLRNWPSYFESERSPANEDCETEERSVFTQLELPTGEAEQSEQTPANEDCEAEVEENQRSLIWVKLVSFEVCLEYIGSTFAMEFAGCFNLKCG